jgi:uncharacterized protein (DUF2147 family)
MARNLKRAVGGLVLAVAASGTAAAQSSPIGIWLDQSKRGAVEITDCGGKLCGRIVWLKEARHKAGCNFQIIGDVKPVSGNKWDGGWIVDPEKDPNRRYDVEITPLGDQRLKVMGYAGMKFLSETMTWTRAPADLRRCDQEDAKPAADTSPPGTDAPPAREAERTDAPPAAAPAETPKASKAPAESKPAKAARKSKDCKIDYGGYSFKVPCSALD